MRKGQHHSEETKKCISQKLIGYPQSDETRQKRSKSLTGKQFTDGRKEHISVAKLAKHKKLTQMEKARISIATKKAMDLPEIHEKLLVAQAIANSDPEVIMHKSLGQKRRFLDPLNRQKVRDKMNSPETHQKLVEIAKRPEVVEAKSRASKGRVMSQAELEMRCEAQQLRYSDPIKKQIHTNAIRSPEARLHMSIAQKEAENHFGKESQHHLDLRLWLTYCGENAGFRVLYDKDGLPMQRKIIVNDRLYAPDVTFYKGDNIQNAYEKIYGEVGRCRKRKLFDLAKKHAAIHVPYHGIPYFVYLQSEVEEEHAFEPTD